ncbi:hypothetical protein JCGZ_21902 [Jatropha curcas]|uniref:Bifunctional inhibitor/plant lipid transfer protein/seed storage helical domain-containing protein n=1 Tax=Jatropha curcas TaxID=180498 RepID=A0A067JC52_JATCU|nr:non-specific lipid-transfer protein-like protein At2g13820 [Jatropha curcas]KDP21431.1 hypothetical protein JCGZ_21902 [Jatropha curcas]
MEIRRKELEIILTLAVIATFWLGANAQLSCRNVLISMSPCLNYITGNSTTPSSQCCTQLATVVRSRPRCLCQVLNGGASSLGVNVNQTQALALPNACNVKTPPISNCNGSSPAASPSGTPNSPSGGGSRSRPTADNGTSNGNSINFTFSLLFFLFFIAFHAPDSIS